MTSANAPTEFPIPPDLEGFWQWDKMHCPRPQTTLTQDIFNTAISAGFTGAMDEFACPAKEELKPSSSRADDLTATAGSRIPHLTDIS